MNVTMSIKKSWKDIAKNDPNMKILKWDNDVEKWNLNQNFSRMVFVWNPNWRKQLELP